jgi:hypothetical protein
VVNGILDKGQPFVLFNFLILQVKLVTLGLSVKGRATILEDVSAGQRGWMGVNTLSIYQSIIRRRIDRRRVDRVIVTYKKVGILIVENAETGVFIGLCRIQLFIWEDLEKTMSLGMKYNVLYHRSMEIGLSHLDDIPVIFNTLGRILEQKTLGWARRFLYLMKERMSSTNGRMI